MNTQNWRGIGLAIAVSAMVCQLAHAEGGRPSRLALEQMGLGSLVVMSDDEAMSVRGHGFHGGSSVVVWGNSIAAVDTRHGGAMSENGYILHGKHFAAGKNLSFAGKIEISSGPHGGPGGDMGGGNWGGDTGGGYPGGMPGGHPGGGKPNIKATIVFAGGFSSGVAF
jgi:hypothetical protein